ncbi:MAG: hypothetical protein K8R56_01570, partial [Candidatus Eisenbacteria bacterium]|nr:hypothetical protein [Candidatus Eisenbacteria bacterium]
LVGGVQHAKFMMVDGDQAWLGSQNLDWRALSHIMSWARGSRSPRWCGRSAMCSSATGPPRTPPPPLRPRRRRSAGRSRSRSTVRTARCGPARARRR